MPADSLRDDPCRNDQRRLADLARAACALILPPCETPTECRERTTGFYFDFGKFRQRVSLLHARRGGGPRGAIAGMKSPWDSSTGYWHQVSRSAPASELSFMAGQLNYVGRKIGGSRRPSLSLPLKRDRLGGRPR